MVGTHVKFSCLLSYQGYTDLLMSKLGAPTYVSRCFKKVQTENLLHAQKMLLTSELSGLHRLTKVR